MPPASTSARVLLDRALATGRIHSAYLLAGPSGTVRGEAQRFARALVCTSTDARPCEQCRECQRSSEEDAAVELDGAGKRGLLF